MLGRVMLSAITERRCQLRPGEDMHRIIIGVGRVDFYYPSLWSGYIAGNGVVASFLVPCPPFGKSPVDCVVHDADDRGGYVSLSIRFYTSAAYVAATQDNLWQLKIHTTGKPRIIGFASAAHCYGAYRPSSYKIFILGSVRPRSRISIQTPAERTRSPRVVHRVQDRSNCCNSGIILPRIVQV